MTTYRALTYCQDFPDTERYDYGSAYGRDREAFLVDLRRHLEQCERSARRVVEVVVIEDGGQIGTTTTYHPTNAAPGHLPDIAAVVASIFPEVIEEEEDTAPTAARPPSPVADIVGWTYEADHHCPRHAAERFGDALTAPDTTDREGNPLHPVFSWDLAGDFPDVCIDCIAEAIATRPGSHSDQDIDRHNAAAALSEPRQCVTASGVQFMLPGEEPAPVRKGDATDQTRMF